MYIYVIYIYICMSVCLYVPALHVCVCLCVCSVQVLSYKLLTLVSFFVHISNNKFEMNLTTISTTILKQDPNTEMVKIREKKYAGFNLSLIHI